MKLWLLMPIEELKDVEDPWEPWYDKAFGFVVRAETEEEARKMANIEGGAETREINPWLDPKFSTCVELTSEGEAGVIIRDFESA